MDKIMKKIILLGFMAFGTMFVAKAPAQAHDYISSTWTAQFVAYITTVNTPVFAGGLSTTSAGGILSGGGFELQRVLISTGYGNGAYFVCVDTLPSAASTGGAYLLTNYQNEQYLFPPMTFFPSTYTVTANNGGLSILDLRDLQGGGRTVKNGILCFQNGDTTNRYWWQLETAETPSASERR